MSLCLLNRYEVLLLLHYRDVYRGYKEEELSTYMEGLHAYNEMKDIGQMLLGRLGKFYNTANSVSYNA